jgi:hypothetical protein
MRRGWMGVVSSIFWQVILMLPLAVQRYQTSHGGVQRRMLMDASAVTVLPVVVLSFATTGSQLWRWRM